jgi:hypothetical protein
MRLKESMKMKTFQCDTHNSSGKFLSRVNVKYQSRGNAVAAFEGYNAKTGDYTVVKALNGVRK